MRRKQKNQKNLIELPWRYFSSKFHSKWCHLEGWAISDWVECMHDECLKWFN